MQNTPYRCMISRNFTVTAASANPVPRENKMIYANGMNARKIVMCIRPPVTSTTARSATNDASRFTAPDKIFATTSMCFGTYTFLIREAFPTMDSIASVVDD